MSTILVKVRKSVKELGKTPIQAAERAWNIDDNKILGIDTVVAVCDAKIVGVFQVNSYNKIQTGSDAGKYEFDLTDLGQAGIDMYADIPRDYLTCRNTVIYY